MGECRERVERALAVLEGDEATTARQRMQLSAALGWSLMYGVGRARETSAAWATTLELAERLDDQGYRLRALWGLCIDQFNILGLVHRSVQHRRASHRARIRPAFCRPGGKFNRCDRFDDGRSHPRHRAALPWRPEKRSSPHRAHARKPRGLGAAAPDRPLSVRSAGD